ncbi:hypothetical protein AB434_3141 [Heyndrickxia coagulans]|uniref:Uncharacterized protein n=1 Tax=Heyndrickxia coagulans TaxID=1398 RepID=A0AAN0WBY9_HEYCO|nr:hypothetical protein SB48_HM08orf03398 [Heyndrickxia coagulans]AKN55546.1 hypothetical protein AB434_3141 [Heyndrickxia coagulans]
MPGFFSCRYRAGCGQFARKKSAACNLGLPGKKRLKKGASAFGCAFFLNIQVRITR